MAQSTNASMEHSELSQQRRGLLSERDTLLAQQQAMQTEYEKVTCGCFSATEPLPIHSSNVMLKSLLKFLLYCIFQVRAVANM